MLARVASVITGLGDSSTSFWWRRWVEQSRSPRATTLPCMSPMIWISMWRARLISASMMQSPLPKAASASRCACSRPETRLASLCATRMPRPPPPAVALIITGKPILCAIAIASSCVFTGPAEPGTVGTPASMARALALALLPSASIDWLVGPMNSILQSRTTCAKWLFSERKP